MLVAVLPLPPAMVETSPLAVFPSPPATVAREPLATSRMPPPTVAEVPAAFRPIGLVGGRGALYAVALRTDGPLGTGLPQALLRSDDGGAHWAEVRLPVAG